MNSSKPELPDAGNTSVRLGPAFLRPAKEKGHYELMRPIVTLANEGDRLTRGQHPDPVGPIAVYRTKGRGDKVDMTKVSRFAGPPPEMKTMDPRTKQPIELILVWWPGMDGENAG